MMMGVDLRQFTIRKPRKPFVFHSNLIKPDPLLSTPEGLMMVVHRKKNAKDKRIKKLIIRLRRQSIMASHFSVVARSQQKLPVLFGASNLVPYSLFNLSCRLSNAKPPRNWTLGSRNRTSRRLVLCVGASFWSQFMEGMTGNFTGKSFLASARQKSAIEEVLKNVEWPEQFPYKSEDFQRYDESPDTQFYDYPRFVTHIDDYAITALTKYYSKVFPPSNTPGVSILDMCSSWVSHYPPNYKQDRIVGMGMNEEELKRNSVLTEYIVQDLNINPKLPFEDSSFDIITNVVSVDYLTKPIEVFKEMHRILKPGGLAIMSFSNRCFWTKAISIWTSTSDAEHVWIVGSYFHYAGGFEAPQAVDISPNPGRSDPMYIVCSRKEYAA